MTPERTEEIRRAVEWWVGTIIVWTVNVAAIIGGGWLMYRVIHGGW